MADVAKHYAPITPILFLQLILGIIGAFQAFNQVQVLTGAARTFPPPAELQNLYRRLQWKNVWLCHCGGVGAVRHHHDFYRYILPVLQPVRLLRKR